MNYCFFINMTSSINSFEVKVHHSSQATITVSRILKPTVDIRLSLAFIKFFSTLCSENINSRFLWSAGILIVIQERRPEPQVHRQNLLSSTFLVRYYKFERALVVVVILKLKDDVFRFDRGTYWEVLYSIG